MRTRPIVTLFVALTCGTLLAACGGGSSSTPTDTPAAGSTASVSATAGAESTPASSPTASDITPVAPGDSVSVTGIVGTVTTDPPAIEITRLSGADVTRIQVQDATVIRSATGSRIDLSTVRSSDRIIADGHINDRGDALIADDIAVSAVVPGAQPGG
ncbi:MAG TPA: hypothetical protein VFY79_12220 [Dehalococcoidia bacterium]|nr:hypothetical protein [Dehalococcoidia bacterium]